MLSISFFNSTLGVNRIRLLVIDVALTSSAFSEPFDCPDPLYHHFFRSFAMSAGITLHMMVIRGFDEHHIIEAGFKSLGLALKGAIVKRDSELSTKDKVKVK